MIMNHTIFEVHDFSKKTSYFFATEILARNKVAEILKSYRKELLKYNERTSIKKSEGYYFDCGMEYVDVVSINERVLELGE
jgi:hypothetical protein